MQHQLNEDLYLNCVFLTTKEALIEHKRLSKEAFKLHKPILANCSTEDFLVKFKSYNQYLQCFKVSKISEKEIKFLNSQFKLNIENYLNSGLNFVPGKVLGINLLIDPEEIIEDYTDDDDE